MKAIILAAGKGSRLLPYTKDTPKSLVKINNIPLIHYTLENFNKNKITEIIIVVGYLHEKYVETIGNNYKNVKITYVVNKKYKTTDNMDSLWLANKHIDDDVIIMNADVLSNHKLIQMIVNDTRENITIVEKNNKLTDSSMQVKINNGTITNFKRGIKDGDGRAIGIHKFSLNGAKSYFKIIKKLIEHKEKPYILEDALIKFIASFNFHAIYSNGIPWVEIDDAKDLQEARELIEDICLA